MCCTFGANNNWIIEKVSIPLSYLGAVPIVDDNRDGLPLDPTEVWLLGLLVVSKQCTLVDMV